MNHPYRLNHVSCSISNEEIFVGKKLIHMLIISQKQIEFLSSIRNIVT